MPGKPHTLPLKEAVPWGAVGTGRASLAAGSSLAVPQAAGSRSIPTPGLRGVSNGMAHLKRSQSPGVWALAHLPLG